MRSQHEEFVRELQSNPPLFAEAEKAARKREPLRVVDAHALLAMNIPPREMLLDPWLPAQSFTMLYAKRGTGKTLLALSIAYALASGSEVLGWHASKPRKVLYLDGEMLSAPMQQRLANLVRGTEREPEPGMLNILTPDLQKSSMPNLTTGAGQDALDEAVPVGTELIIVDSLSSLARGIARENEAESWTPVAAWALAHRVAGRSILFLHHAGKGGAQRGTSAREDLLDVVLALRSPTDHKPNQGAKFEIHIEKSRALCKEFVPVEASIVQEEGGGISWAARTIEETLRGRIISMDADGMSRREIAEELHVNRSTVYRHLRER